MGPQAGRTRASCSPPDRKGSPEGLRQLQSKVGMLLPRFTGWTTVLPTAFIGLTRYLFEPIFLVMTTTVLALAPFNPWYLGLDAKDQESVTFYIDLLREQGVRLPYPYSSAVTTSRWAMRELRVQSGGRPLRVLYVFDHDRQAVLILGGDKTGDDRFYTENVPKADRLYAEYHAAVVKQKAAEAAAAKKQSGKKKSKK